MGTGLHLFTYHEKVLHFASHGSDWEPQRLNRYQEKGSRGNEKVSYSQNGLDFLLLLELRGLLAVLTLV